MGGLSALAGLLGPQQPSEIALHAVEHRLALAKQLGGSHALLLCRRDLPLGRGTVGLQLGAGARQVGAPLPYTPDHIGVLPARAFQEVEALGSRREAAAGEQHLGRGGCRSYIKAPQALSQRCPTTRQRELVGVRLGGVLADALLDVAEPKLRAVERVGRGLKLGINARDLRLDFRELLAF